MCVCLREREREWVIGWNFVCSKVFTFCWLFKPWPVFSVLSKSSQAKMLCYLQRLMRVKMSLDRERPNTGSIIYLTTLVWLHQDPEMIHKETCLICCYIWSCIINQCNHGMIIILEHLIPTGQAVDFTGKMFAVILGVWKVLAALLHHLLNSASAVSSWLEFSNLGLFVWSLFSCCLTACYTVPLSFSTKVPSHPNNSSLSTLLQQPCFCGNI